MSVSAIELYNFRSYREARFEFDPSVTLIVGPNGSGKTNILEALYVLATTKSFRARDEALIQHNNEFYRVVVQDGGTDVQLAYQNSPTTTKRVSYGGVKKSLRSHIGSIPVVLFEPGDLQLLAGPPKARRAYIDTILCQTDAEYLAALNEYKRALRQRNALLTEHNTVPGDLLFAWNVRLAGPAIILRAKRDQFIAYLKTKLPELYNKIAGKEHDINLEYIPSPLDPKSLNEETFLTALERVLARDTAAGFTTIGPHRDDFEVIFDNKPIGSIASRGEHRSVVLALKLAELEYQAEFARATPLFMLDDVFSELDASRRAFLLEAIGAYQTIVTTTEADAVRDKNYYTIKLGGDHE